MLNRPPPAATADTAAVPRGLGAKLPPKLTSILLAKQPFRPPPPSPSTPSSPPPVAAAASNAAAQTAAADLLSDPASKVKKMHTGSSTTSSTATATTTTNPSDPAVSAPVSSVQKPPAGIPFSAKPIHQRQQQQHNHHMHHMHHHTATTTSGTTPPPWVQQPSAVASTTAAAIPTPVAPEPAPLPAVSSGVMHVVILGGSFSGLSVAVTLAKITRNSQPSSTSSHHAYGAGGGGFGGGLGGGNHHRNSTNSTTSTSSNGNPTNGGGGGGLMPTHNRDRAAVHITLVEPKTYLEVRWATIRSLFDSSVCDASTVPLSKVLAEHAGTITHVRARGKAVLLDTVVLDDGRHIPYDVLLIATGAVTAYAPLTPHLTPSSSSGMNKSAAGTPLGVAEFVRQSRDGSRDQDEDQGHGSLAQRRLFLQQTGAAILQARSVAIVGGGPVGTELAADIAAYARHHQQQRLVGHEVKVTLVDANDKLMPGYPRAIAQKLRDKLAAVHVRVILGHSAVRVSGGEGDTPGTTVTGTNPEVWELYPCDKSGSSTSGSGGRNGNGNGRSSTKDGHQNNNNSNNYYYNNGHSKGKGKRLDADLVICATGVRPCEKGFFADGQVGGAESVRDGWIRTDRFGRVIGCRGDVFAAGDCCDWSAKSGENTLANRHTYAHNVRVTCDAIANNRALASIDSKLRRVSTSHRPPAVVASQPRDGETTSAFVALSPSWWWMKNRGMLLAKAQREIGW